MDLITSLEHFLTYLRLHKGRSMKTLEQYEFHLWRLFTYLDPKLISKKNEQGKDLWNHKEVFLDISPEKRGENRELRNHLKKQCSINVEQITKEDIDTFRLELNKNNLSVKSINAHIITYRSWLKYLKKEGVSCLDPTVLDLMHSSDREVTFLTSDELTRFFNSITRDNIRGLRDYAICQCIYSTGLRISELTSLNRSDVNLETMEFAIRGKGNKIRVVYLTERARDAIREYIEKREDDFPALFIRHNEQHSPIIKKIKKEDTKDLLKSHDPRLSRFYITTMIKNYGIQAGILKNLHAHTLRHSFATTLLTNGADIRIIQELLGHASITTTQVYTHVTNPKLKEAHKKFHI